MKTVASAAHLRHGHAVDVLIAGAGIVGLSLALELRERGATVMVLDRAAALGGASRAAAGMLAAEDPHHPPALLPLARYSLSLYPHFLRGVEALSGRPVTSQTTGTVQYRRDGTTERLAEISIDPRELGSALLGAVRAASVHVAEHTVVSAAKASGSCIDIATEAGGHFRARHFVQTTGAWPLPGACGSHLPLEPRKGQMLRVVVPRDAPLREVHRAEHVYVVPRTSGAQAGTALIGATVEDVGFDLSIQPEQLGRLREAAASLSSDTAFAAQAPLVEAWAGLRPCTPDFLPVLGPLGRGAIRAQGGQWIAGGHFRNGILLAPATALILADLLSGRAPAIDVSAFAPERFSRTGDRP